MSEKNLTRMILELGRPFEALQWSRSSVPAAAANQLATIDMQRAELTRNPSALRMASESALVGVDPQQFEIESATKKLRLTSPVNVTTIDEVETDIQMHLTNVATETGLNFRWYPAEEPNFSSIPMHEMMGGGIAVIDFDRDGWPDFYFAQGSGNPPTTDCTRSNALFRNLGSQFAPVTELAQALDFSFSSGLAAGDVNQDGFTDLLLGSLGGNRLLINNGDGTFHDATESWGSVEHRFTSSLAIADIDGDALPDMFEANYIEMEGGFALPKMNAEGREIQPMPLSFYADTDRWFKNNGNGTFQVHEIPSDIAEPATGLGLIVTDFDGDNANEIFVANDARPNHFLVHVGKGEFRNVAAAKGLANGFAGEANGCMGIAAADFNQDNTLDLHVTNYINEPANQYVQTSAGGFRDVASRYRIDSFSRPYVGFGTKAVDIDRNGWVDLIVTNGHVFDRRDAGQDFHMPMQLLINKGSHFQPMSVHDETGYWSQQHLGRALAMTDYDRDGRLDFLVGHLDQPVALLHNQTKGGNWIQFSMIGTESERDAVGARIVITVGDQRLTGWVLAGDGYLCSDEAVVDFGLGAIKEVDQVEVFWPSGLRQTIQSPKLGTRHLVVEGDPECLLW